jgi:peptidoglycan/LPS O-acetylase OafA/YrhL
MHQHAETGTEPFDGLRGIAILMVVIFHTWLFSWYTPALSIADHPIPIDTFARTGYLGVELFFMISGFVLFFPYARAALGSGKTLSLREFARRRFFKIAPSYALALLATTLVAIPVVNSTPDLLGSVFNHVFFFQNFYNDKLGGVNSVFWSLAVEVQFYLIFPLLAIAFVRGPFVVAPAMIAVALWYRYHVAACCLQIEPVTRQLPAFLDVFACGMAAAYALVWLRAKVPNLERYAPLFTLVAASAVVAGFALLASADSVAYVPGGKERWLLGNRTLFALAGAVLGLASCLANTWWRRILTNPGLGFLAIISYNLYLWHTLVLIWMWQHGVPPAATANPHDDSHWKAVYIATGWLACLVISIAITYFIERPLLGTGRRPPFSFDWRFTRAPSIARSETHT